jgi:hypothetical protein
LQLRRTAGQVDAGDGAFAQANAAAALQVIVAIAVTVSVAGDELGDELVQVGIMAYEQDSLAAGVLGDELLKGGIVSIGRKSRRGEDRRLKTDLGGHELGGLAGTFERAGDDDVDLHLERSQDAGHEHALLLAFFDQAAFGVKYGIFAWDARIRVAHEIEVHGVSADQNLGQNFSVWTILTRL